MAVSHAGRLPASGAGRNELSGRVLAGRYRLIAPLGSGASAQVLLADDVQLRRRVAVKVLHAGLAGDPTFLRRFQAEAQAAAALNHPNVVAVYDWGQDEVPFIVTEFLDGGSLRAILDSGDHLSLSQTLLVGLEACRALHYAHSRGFVHRDIKPANLLYGEDHRLRVADFGLARALAEASWTEPEGVVLGTARYVSPEQAAGAPVDPRSDVYSLALVLVECVTGSVPHAADTAMATLRARLASAVEPDDRLGLLAPLLAQAGTVEPEQRWTAGQLGSALMAVAEQLPPPDPIPLVPPRRGYALVDPGPATALYIEPGHERLVLVGEGPAGPGAGAPEPVPLPVRPTATAQPSGALAAPDAVGAAAVGTGGTGTTGTGVVDFAVDDEDDGVSGDAGGHDADGADGASHPSRNGGAGRAARQGRSGRGSDGERPGRRGRRRFGPARIALATLLVAALTTLGLLAAGVFSVSSPFLGTATYLVDDFTGRDVDAVRTDLETGIGWRVDVSDDRADGKPVNSVLSQDPAPGAKLAKGATVHLVRSIGPTEVFVPAVVGKPIDDPIVVELFADATLAVRRVDAFDESHPAGQILAIEHVATKVERGTTVSVTVSAGPQPRTLGEYAGQGADKASADLTAKGLQPNQVDEASETVAKGTVIRTEPGPGQQLPKGGSVNLVVSSGRPKLTVPSYLIGMTGRQAEDELTALGWTVNRIDGPSSGIVIATDPPGGAVRDKGSPIRIITQQN